MHKYVIYHYEQGHSSSKEFTHSEYQIGEIIHGVHNPWIRYKCIKKEEVNGELVQHLKQGKISYSYDY